MRQEMYFSAISVLKHLKTTYCRLSVTSFTRNGFSNFKNATDTKKNF